MMSSNENGQYGRFVRRFFISISVFLASIGTFVFICDPYLYYHTSGIYDRTYMKNLNARYQMASMVKHFKYDTLIAGTSMVHNFKEESVNEKLKTVSFNASLSGSSAKEQRKVVELALASKMVKHVYWELNYDSLSGGKDRIDPSFPAYFYDTNILNDLPYLVSYSSLQRIESQWKLKDKINMNADPLQYYKFGHDKKPVSLDNIGVNLKKPEKPQPVPAGHTNEAYMESFKENVLPVVEKNKDVRFTFLYTPYPVTRHIAVYNSSPEMMEGRLKFKRDVYDALSQLKNTEIYDFQDEQSITFNLGNYMDRSHYFMYINEWMLDYMAEKHSIQSKEEYHEKIDSLKMQVQHFEWKQLTRNYKPQIEKTSSFK
ncbi:hypothetical protein [Fictibacillus phosphorivorans]|uniref:hypothetical protein n=1 Tax=Fictibacillus phosphorivorans TaxID=1221500 RepID=UPI0035E8F163